MAVGLQIRIWFDILKSSLTILCLKFDRCFRLTLSIYMQTVNLLKPLEYKINGSTVVDKYCNETHSLSDSDVISRGTTFDRKVVG